MLSILIPIYQCDVRDLVYTLYSQCRAEAIDFEIRCYDDGSDEPYRRTNSELRQLSHVVYSELPRNIGRARIRNMLIRQAHHPYLLLLDNDVNVSQSDFIRQYVQYAEPGKLIVGGRTYSEKPPSDRKLYLHWLYGSQRESKPAIERRQHPWRGFQSNNYLIHRDLAMQFPFDEQLTQYGHEDTLFALALEKERIPVVHIDNPALHEGLERATVFLEKHRKAVENLLQLYRKGIILNTRLMDAFQLAHTTKLQNAALLLYDYTYKHMRNHLLSDSPSLTVFDAYRLGYMLQLERNN